MQKLTGSIATIGLTAIAMPAAAQEIYLGASLSTGSFTSDSFGPIDDSIQSFEIFGGARFDVGSQVFVGVELQASSGDGYMLQPPRPEPRNAIYQGEVHLGYNFDPVLVYAFAGIGVTNFERAAAIVSASHVAVGGIGAEIPLQGNIALRVEAELSRLSIEDNCCGRYDPANQRDLSLGVVFNF